MIRFTGFAFVILSLISGSATAEAPNLRTPSPVIYLVDNQDEADKLGWCIDTIGRGFAEQLHAHSCKPRGGDVQFSFDPQTMQIKSVAFEAKCVELGPVNEPLRLLDCSSAATQQFNYSTSTGRITPVENPDICLTVGEQSRSAGPYMSRDLRFQLCDGELAYRQAWVVVE